ncbi:alpha/beta hydrolase [Methylobacterium sp. 17Sr1-1]|uniref:alpha/beta hydrolase n=1 Tax=Methylobacterium sp. 17Sr1-1 TaxID=2202826 RepID=UPI000D6F0D95|nr:alpha/beta hydrolase [Methylobacterium sp. 17Sr1-1]AWN52159.1 hypothetical protein DK412_11155 [Methylobacterium sp. 17Sr1-1]
MPYRTLPGRPEGYALLAFDREGVERDDPVGEGGPFSAHIIRRAVQERATDIFIQCHGWKGDVPAAIDQYDRWFGAMVALAPDAEAMTRLSSGFRPFRIGVHWPSLPWGDEELGPAASFSMGTDLVELYTQRLGVRPGLREAVERVVAAAEREPDAARLPPDAEDAYREIDALLTEIGSAGEAGAPGDDRKPFDPQTYFNAAQAEASFGWSEGLGGILAPLRQLSFWKMKERARALGESGLNAFLADLRRGTGARIHIMGHSFGSIVASAMVCGPSGAGKGQAVSSLALVQGALSLWSYCDDIPVSPGRPGYFQRLIAEGLVTGPIIITRSRHDVALGRYYPLGAGVADQVDYSTIGELPRYGAVGTFGAKGLTQAAVEADLEDAAHQYGFERGRIYNLDGDRFIKDGGGSSGAHNDIDGPEVAHAVWQAALAGARTS